MSDVIHATARAIAIIKHRNGPGALGAVADTIACTGARDGLKGIVFYAAAALVMLAGKCVRTERGLGNLIDADLPTCQRCRVLLDEAWEHPVEVSR